MRSIWILTAALAAFSACTGGGGEEQAGEPTRYEAVGVVKGVKSEGRVLIIDHRDIPGFMEAMVMPFAVADAKLSAGLKVGDTVQFTLSQNTGDWPITEIKKIN